MIQPTVLFYARLNYDQKSGKTPKYVVTKVWGDYKPMECLKGRNSLISMYLMPKREGQSSNCPPMKLQAKNSLNLTGLKDYFIDGRLSGYAYGYPLQEPTYSKKNTPNPFYEHREDGFLFLVYQDKDAPTPAEQIKPDYMEFLVLAGAKVLISSYAKQLVLGGFNDTLEALRRDSLSIG